LKKVAINVFHLPRGGAPEAVEADCTMGRPGGRGPVLRLHIREDLECSKGDVLIFDFNLVPEHDPK
jgi:hypothetical protein